MTLTDWLPAICVLGMLIVVLVVAYDRNRLRHRLDNAHGHVASLLLDVETMRERVEQLSSYLNRPASWDVDAHAPASLTDPVAVDHFSSPASPLTVREPAAGSTEDASAGRAQHLASGRRRPAQ